MRGRFATGNPGGPGNPHARWAARLNAAYRAAVTPDDLREIIIALVRRAKNGNILAAREILRRAGIKDVILSTGNQQQRPAETSSPDQPRAFFGNAKDRIAS